MSYLNGVELTTQNSLPLRVMMQSEFEESQHWLATQDTLIFVSDGIVEACNSCANRCGLEQVTGIILYGALLHKFRIAPR